MQAPLVTDCISSHIVHSCVHSSMLDAVSTHPITPHTQPSPGQSLPRSLAAALRLQGLRTRQNLRDSREQPQTRRTLERSLLAQRQELPRLLRSQKDPLVQSLPRSLAVVVRLQALRSRQNLRGPRQNPRLPGRRPSFFCSRCSRLKG
jgi:hypothetical protein